MRIKTNQLIRILISLFFILLLLWIMREKLEDTVKVLKMTNIFLFLLASSIYFFVVLALSFRLKKILQTQTISFPLKEVTYLNFIGLFFNNFFPTTVGGDFVKAYYTSRRTSRIGDSFVSIFMDRIVGLLSFIFIACIALFILRKMINDQRIIFTFSFLLIGAVFTIYILLRNNAIKIISYILKPLRKFKVDSGIIKLHQGLRALMRQKKLLVQVFLISVFAQAISIAIVYVLCLGLNINISIGILFLVMPIVTAASMLPSLNGLGIRESAFVYFLSSTISKEQAFALSILWLSIYFLMSLIGGVIYLFVGKNYVPKLKDGDRND